ncbi:MAG: signal peptidase II [Deltaproteobacteria bacterium]|nr:signal peptidase II [Deltaproteobacteria bacterium]
MKASILTIHKTFLTTAALIVVIDQITKFIIRDSLVLFQSIEVILGIFNITYIRNPGAAFGIFGEESKLFRQIFLIGTSVAAIGIIASFYLKSKTHLARLGLSMIAGGALGNLIDRILFGEVTDFLDLYLGSYHWPAFNIADSSITIGVGITIYAIYMKK